MESGLNLYLNVAQSTLKKRTERYTIREVKGDEEEAG